MSQFFSPEFVLEKLNHALSYKHVYKYTQEGKMYYDENDYSGISLCREYPDSNSLFYVAKNQKEEKDTLANILISFHPKGSGTQVPVSITIKPISHYTFFKDHSGRYNEADLDCPIRSEREKANNSEIPKEVSDNNIVYDLFEDVFIYKDVQKTLPEILDLLFKNHLSNTKLINSNLNKIIQSCKLHIEYIKQLLCFGIAFVLKYLLMFVSLPLGIVYVSEGTHRRQRTLEDVIKLVTEDSPYNLYEKRFHLDSFQEHSLKTSSLTFPTKINRAIIYIVILSLIFKFKQYFPFKKFILEINAFYKEYLNMNFIVFAGLVILALMVNQTLQFLEVYFKPYLESSFAYLNKHLVRKTRGELLHRHIYPKSPFEN